MTTTTHSTTTHPETTIAADPAVPTIRISREFAAPPAAVFRAHTDPDLVARWLGPRSVTMVVERWDATTGGAYRYKHTRGDEEYGFYGSFHEVREPSRIVQTFTFGGFPDGVCLETLTLTDLGDGRTRLDAVSVYDSFEVRDMALSSGMQTGVVEGYEQLDEVLAS
ncbi:SRPBCC family protein [Saccharothrix yanglingensis]|uniref:Polyketide cyclase n=1 Tax=Saccharothrix yanglingensis TaxID=659496 RepID=A0ABU0X4G2_9PSEU|nr:SRPBCC family protein [Saccharothrix yanglingensis]MDQ2587025.1 polyketide cyclase [Saccharothrix yanglingensis]